jgi:hypothetical protein
MDRRNAHMRKKDEEENLMFINETYFLSIQLVTPKNSKFTCSEYNFK